MGPGLVYVFLKTHFFTVLFIQYVQTKEPFKQELYHEMFASRWLPYWLTSVMLRGEAIQVYNDMLVWDSKRFGHNIYYRKNCQADDFILNWRTWFSKYYRGCSRMEKAEKSCDWWREACFMNLNIIILLNLNEKIRNSKWIGEWSRVVCSHLDIFCHLSWQPQIDILFRYLQQGLQTLQERSIRWDSQQAKECFYLSFLKPTRQNSPTKLLNWPIQLNDSPSSIGHWKAFWDLAVPWLKLY